LSRWAIRVSFKKGKTDSSGEKEVGKGKGSANPEGIAAVTGGDIGGKREILEKSHCGE